MPLSRAASAVSSCSQCTGRSVRRSTSSLSSTAFRPSQRTTSLEGTSICTAPCARRSPPSASRRRAAQRPCRRLSHPRQRVGGKCPSSTSSAQSAPSSRRSPSSTSPTPASACARARVAGSPRRHWSSPTSRLRGSPSRFWVEAVVGNSGWSFLSGPRCHPHPRKRVPHNRLRAGMTGRIVKMGAGKLTLPAALLRHAKMAHPTRGLRRPRIGGTKVRQRICRLPVCRPRTYIGTWKMTWRWLSRNVVVRALRLLLRAAGPPIILLSRALPCQFALDTQT
mmetsp:Transcript_6759/g.20477  ORF Transcript_6759/g.20477 Transcript_6759/m.20477 type:complete len:280 (+) Transcript_6759:607-1446(+)